jgi:hypothetical protein
MRASFADSGGLFTHPTTIKQIANVGAEKRKLIEDHTALAMREKPKAAMRLLIPETTRDQRRSSPIFLHASPSTLAQSKRSG